VVLELQVLEVVLIVSEEMGELEFLFNIRTVPVNYAGGGGGGTTGYIGCGSVTNIVNGNRWQ